MAVSHSVVNWNDLAIDAEVPTYFVRLGAPIDGVGRSGITNEKSPGAEPGLLK